MRESSRVDRVILMFSTVVASIPEFALGVFLASVFVVWLGWLPGTATLVAGGGWSVATQLVLPVAVILLFGSRHPVSLVPAPQIRAPAIRTPHTGVDPTATAPPPATSGEAEARTR